MKPLILAMLLLATPAVAQEDLRIDTSRLHVTDPAACVALEDKGVDAWLDIDFRALTFARGIQSMEFDCRFFDVKSSEGSTHLFIDAVCSTPGEVYPDTFAAIPVSETEIQVVSGRDASLALAGLIEPQDPEALPGATTYTRCDTLSEIPR
ncbi:hypothetical protein SAMN02983003_0813 [Devosia enhydra]|uniref:Uncharacterized protein n=1 Tax=Devosia enhydra TaxID=665118 RepID=A0A1K2HU82_9HYPH|nr:hypothetical protein [Devosia enhydra]SFZ81980.1 hypothetical protein SAMN02983003_0813 [Devosia enhydra]